MSYFSINRVVLVGRLTRDPEMRALPSGLSVCGLRVASSTGRRDAEGDYHEKPNFFDVSVFGGAAENVGRYMRKGSRVAVDGRLEWREWESPDKQRREAVTIVADSVQFLDSPADPSKTGEPRGEELNDEFDGVEELAGGGAWEGQEIDPQPAKDLVGVGAGAEEEDLAF
jgi:single-strand DNA-binding protein